LKCWYKEAHEAEWKKPRDIKKDYPSARFLNDNRVVFNIKGNNYRLVVVINYDYGIVGIRFIGTHAQYDKNGRINDLTQMAPKIIKTEKDYKLALSRLEQIFDAKKGTRAGDELELLALLIDNYERHKEEIDLPDPIEAIKFRMEQLGYQQKDLAEVIGLRSRVSEILNRKRKLTLDMIRKLHNTLGIPTEVLIREY